MILQAALKSALNGESLSRETAREVFSVALSEEVDPAQLAGLLVALAMRGETRDELLGAVEAMRSKMQPFEHDARDAIDTCGTGGDASGSFNVSTAAAIVACAAGARVVKHGNRSASSRCGSADLLEAAGVAIELGPERAREVFEEVGITFLFAPRYHPAMRFAAPIRKSLGVRTLFNKLGPLCNPGRVRRQLIGVADAAWIDDFASALEGLEHERAYVVHGAGGADELTLESGNHARAVGSVPSADFEPTRLGLQCAPLSALAGGDARENLALLHTLLAGIGGPIADAVALNAGAALIVAGVAQDAANGVERAREALASGAAKSTLERWVRAGGGSA